MDASQLASRERIMNALWGAEDRGAGSEELRAAGAEAVEGLRALLAEVPGDSDALQVGRTWRFLGDACFALSGKKDQRALDEARAAYLQGEALLQGAGDALEMAKLHCNFANTLRAIGEPPDLPFLEEAGRRYREALKVFRRELPAAVPQVESYLESLEIMRQGTRLFEEARRGYGKIAELMARLEGAGEEPSPEILEEVQKDLESFRASNPGPRAILSEFSGFFEQVAPLLPGTADETRRLRALLADAEGGLGGGGTDPADEHVIAAVQALLERRGGEVSPERRRAIESMFREFVGVMREAPEGIDAGALRVQRMRELIARYKPIFVGAGEDG